MHNSVSGPAARKAFWTAIVLGVLSTLSIVATPFFGILQTGLFLAIAWGIRRRHAWAAITGTCYALVPLMLLGIRSEGIAILKPVDWAMPAFSTGIMLVAAYFFFSAAKELWPDRSLGTALPWLSIVLLMIACLLCLRPFAIPTGAMENTLLVGDRILVETVGQLAGRSPRLGDIVAIQYPIDRRQTFIKRIVGVPGDRIRIQNKQLLRNGAVISEPYAIHTTEYMDSYRDNFPNDPNVPLYPPADAMLKNNVRDREVVVPEGKYFVLGDNRDSSLDSRYWGFITRDDVVGRPLLIYDSFDTRGNTAPPTILNTRWNRVLKRF